MQPPRALVVPFELGRPLGAPENSGFQQQVLDATFALLQKPTTGPHIASFTQDAPALAAGETESAAALEGWSCPVTFNAEATEDNQNPLLAEIAALQPWYQQAYQRRGRTSADTSGLPMTDVAELLSQAHAGATASELGGGNTTNALPYGDLVKLAAEDLKLFYAEAAMEQPNPGTSDQLQDWFWDETHAGKLLLQMAGDCANHPDKALRLHARFTLAPRQRLAAHQAAKTA